MITREYIAEMAAYNEWQNEVVVGLCDSLGELGRVQDRGMFFGSVHHTLDHILMVDRAILTYLENEIPPASAYTDILWPDWESFKVERSVTDKHLKQCAHDWDLDWIAANADVRSPRMPGAKSVPRWVLVTQLFNHQTHHRSQVTSELHRAGLDYGSTDIPFRPGSGYFVS